MLAIVAVSLCRLCYFRCVAAMLAISCAGHEEYKEGHGVRMKCSTHTKCVREYKVVFSHRNRQLNFYVTRDRQHSDGASRKILGFTVPQWKILAASSAPTVDALLMELSRAGCPHRDRRVLASWMGYAVSPGAKLKFVVTRGALLQWLASRSRGNLQPTRKLTPYTLVVASHSGVLDPAETFQITFTCEAWMGRGEKIVKSLNEFLEYFTDGTNKLCENRQCAFELQDEAAQAIIQAQRPTRAEERKKLKTNGLLTLCHGFQSAQYSYGSAEKKQGGLEKYRFSYEQLSVTFRQAGEHTDAFTAAIKDPLDYAQKYHPKVAELLKAPVGVNSDYTGGCIGAYKAVYGVTGTDAYAVVDDVVTATTTTFLRLCVDHAIPNLTGPGKHGRSLLRNCDDKEFTANLLRGRCDFAFRRLGLVLFDAFARHFTRELHAGSLGPAIGTQPEWAEYFEKYIFLETVKGGEPMLNAHCRSGPDRKGRRASNSLSETRNRKVKAGLRKIAKAMLDGLSDTSRPNLIELVDRFESFLEFEFAMGPKRSGDQVAPLPLAIDPNVLSGHKSIRRHSTRLSVKDTCGSLSGRVDMRVRLRRMRICLLGVSIRIRVCFSRPRFAPEEYAAAITANRDKYIVEVDRPPFTYFVMSRGVDPAAPDTRLPAAVDKGKAFNLLEMVTAPPKRDEVDAILLASGVLKPNFRFSFKTLTVDYCDALAVTRVDTRLIAGCKEDPLKWHTAVSCQIPCDAALNNTAAMGCEHCVVSRWLCGDPLASPSAAPIASAQAVDRAAGAPQQVVLGSSRQSEEAAAEAGGDPASRKRTQRQSEADAAKRARADPSPGRDPAAEIDADIAASKFAELRSLTRVLLRPDAGNAVAVRKGSDGESTVSLWDGGRAVGSLKRLQAAVRQTDQLPAGQRLRWEETLKKTQMVHVLSAYKRHPVKEVSAIAGAMMDEVRSCLHRELVGAYRADPASGTGRCDGQASYPSVSVPDAMMLSAMRLAEGTGRHTLLVMVGRPAASGFVATSLWQPSVVDAGDGGLRVDNVEYVMGECTRLGLVPIGLVPVRQGQPLPSSSDVMEFARLASGDKRMDSFRLLVAVGSSARGRFYTLPADVLAKLAAGISAPLELRCDFASFVSAVDDGLGQEQYGVERKGGHQFATDSASAVGAVSPDGPASSCDATIRAQSPGSGVTAPDGSTATTASQAEQGPQSHCVTVRGPVDPRLAAVTAAVERMCGPRSVLRCIEEGGEGDCCFRAVAGGLRSYAANDAEVSDAWLKLLGVQSWASNDDVADALRRVCAHRFAKLSPEELLNAALSYVYQSNNRREWYDGFSPRKLVVRCGLGSVLEGTNVLAVGRHELGDESSIEIAMQDAHGQPFTRIVEDGASKLAKLREQLWVIYAHPCRRGGWHWGTHEDIGALAGALDMGFIVFTSVPSSDRWIYSLALDRGDYGKFMFLISITQVHFMRGQLFCDHWREPCSVIRARDLPEGLSTHYSICNASVPYPPPGAPSHRTHFFESHHSVGVTCFVCRGPPRSGQALGQSCSGRGKRLYGFHAVHNFASDSASVVKKAIALVANMCDCICAHICQFTVSSLMYPVGSYARTCAQGTAAQCV